MSLKHQHLQLLIQTSQFYMSSWHELLKTKHCYFFNITLPWMKIWKWQCSRYLRNHGFPLHEKFQFLKFRYTEDIHKNVFWVFIKSTIVFDIHGHFFIILSKYYLKKLNLKLGIKSSDTYDKENMKLTVSHKGKKCSKIFSYIYCLISQKDLKKNPGPFGRDILLHAHAPTHAQMHLEVW